MKIKILSLLMTVLFCGCSSLLDDVSPDTSVKVPDLTVSTLPLAVKGMYARFSSNGVYAQSAFGEEVASDNLISTYSLSSVSNLANFDLCNVSLDDVLIGGRMFSYPYNGIGSANIIINFVDDGNHNDQVSRQAKGEAMMLRGYCYMLLAERFGKAVITLGKKDEAIIRPQNPEKEVWSQAETDLLTAISLLANYTSPNAGSVQGAQALLARLYLNRGVITDDQQMVAEAGRFARLVIGYSGLELNSDFADNFKSTSIGKETIFRLVETVNTAVGSYQYGLMSPRSFDGTPSGSTFLEQSLIELYDEPTDQRTELLVEEEYAATSQIETYCCKYPADINPVWPVVRLAEMHLIAAEADARMGTVTLTEFNRLRDKRGATQVSAMTATEFLVQIENERRRELVGEGLRWMDMRRFGRLESHLENKGVDKRRIHFPIYNGEITNNPKLTQTDYYVN